MEIGHVIISVTILSLLLLQGGPLSVTGQKFVLLVASVLVKHIRGLSLPKNIVCELAELDNNSIK